MSGGGYLKIALDAKIEGHNLSLNCRGGGCTMCPRDNRILKLYDCQCGICTICGECYYEHVHDFIIKQRSHNLSVALCGRRRVNLLKKTGIRYLFSDIKDYGIH